MDGTRVTPGMNADMHGVEATLAASDVTGDAVWRDRALRLVQHAVHRSAGGNGWRLAEHRDADLTVQPISDTDDRGHQFRPYGVTIGHLLERAGLTLHLRACLGDTAPESWILPEAVSLLLRPNGSTAATRGKR